LLKSALTIFYKSPVLMGQTNVISFYSAIREIVFFRGPTPKAGFFVAER